MGLVVVESPVDELEDIHGSDRTLISRVEVSITTLLVVRAGFGASPEEAKSTSIDLFCPLDLLAQLEVRHCCGSVCVM